MIEVNAFTHRGRVRADNEDSITVGGWVSDVAMSGPRRSRHEVTESLLVAIADGMGGHAAGEVASRYAVKRLAALSFAGKPVDIAAELGTINVELYQTMAAVPSFAGMGTTLAGLVFALGRMVWFNIGDSRVYRIGEGRLTQVSTDDVPGGARSGAITQSLGGSTAFVPVDPHLCAEDFAIPSRWLLCSDGQTDVLGHDEIERAMETDDEQALRTLFAAAMDAGGADNISIIVVSAHAGSKLPGN